jgi:uracil-DNA glycosylase
MTPHFCRGRFPVAFVFSVPGKAEALAGRPVAGDTGSNLDEALIHLRSARPASFPSLDRYDYRITNAYAEPMARSLGHSRSEPTDAEVRDLRTRERVLRDLVDCDLVILGGRKAGSIAQVIRRSGRKVVIVPHVGNQGLNSSIELNDVDRSSSSSGRRQQRIRLWAEAVLRGIETT